MRILKNFGRAVLLYMFAMFISMIMEELFGYTQGYLNMTQSGLIMYLLFYHFNSTYK